MKNGKRSLAMILCLTMLMSTILVLPVHAATYSGSCGTEGDNVQWSLDTTTGLLSITGTGAMNNYSSIGDVPWNSCHSSVKTVTIANGVTSISNYAFWDCTRLTSITIPGSVTRIGNSAFYGCTNLQYNTYENAKYLGNASNPYFALIEASDPGIKSCTIHPDAKLIAGSAFNCCSDLTEIVIPDGVKSIGPGAFFSCTGLKSITIPDGITGIENETFWYCVGLTSITIPGSVTRIGVDAFSDCKGLKSIYYKGTQEQWNQVSKDNSGITDHGVVYYNSCNDAATHTYDANGVCTVCGYEAVAQLGDLNGNGEIDSNDAALLRTHFLTWGGSAGEEAVLAVCDINGNGKVDSNDYVLIRMKVLGLIEAFPRADS